MHSRSAAVKWSSSGREVAVVEDVAVAERRPLRVTGGARRVLDVDRVVRRQGGCADGDRLRGHRCAGGPQCGPVVGVDVHDLLQCRRLPSGGHLLDHPAVVAGLERRGGAQQSHARLADRVGQLVRAIRGVDVDEDRPDPRRGELDDRPLGAARRPHADAVAGLDPDRQQAAGDRIDVAVELGPGPSASGGELDQRFALGMGSDGARQVGPDRLLEQRRRRLARDVRLRHVDPPMADVRAGYSTQIEHRPDDLTAAHGGDRVVDSVERPRPCDLGGDVERAVADRGEDHRAGRGPGRRPR